MSAEVAAVYKERAGQHRNAIWTKVRVKQSLLQAGVLEEIPTLGGGWTDGL